MSHLETSTAIWIFLGLIFVLSMIAASVIIFNSKKNLLYTESIYTNQSSDKTSYWKVVNGKITESKLDYKDSKGLFNKTSREYRPRITYQYYAHDRLHVNSLPLHTWTPSKTTAAKYLNNHQQGDVVVVRFHPDHTDTSIIELNIK